MNLKMAVNLDEVLWKAGDFYFDELEGKYYELVKEESLPAADYVFDSVLGGAEGDFVPMNSDTTDLETQKDDLFFRYLVGVLRKGLVYMEYPAGEQVFTTDKLLPTAAEPWSGYLDNINSPFYNPCPLSVFSMRQGLTVSFKYRNTEGHPLVQKLRFVGKKFIRAGVPSPTAEIKKIAKRMYGKRIS